MSLTSWRAALFRTNEKRLPIPILSRKVHHRPAWEWSHASEHQDAPALRRDDRQLIPTAAVGGLSRRSPRRSSRPIMKHSTANEEQSGTLVGNQSDNIEGCRNCKRSHDQNGKCVQETFLVGGSLFDLSPKFFGERPRENGSNAVTKLRTPIVTPHTMPTLITVFLLTPDNP